MKRMLIILALTGALLSTSCAKDDAKDFNGFKVEQRDGDEALNITFDLSGDIPLVLNEGNSYEVQTVDCHTDWAIGAGRALITSSSGKKWLVMWEDLKEGAPVPAACNGCSQGVGKSPKGLTRVYTTIPTTLGCEDVV